METNNLNEDKIVSRNKIYLNKLKGHIPDEVLSELIEMSIKFNITSNLRIAHFLSQCSHESGGFKLTRENLNYSSTGLKKTFPKYFPGNLSEQYARNPEKIGSRVYGNRLGNGNEESKEGYKYRGAGYIQLTGKENFRKFSKYIGEDCVQNPELVATKYPLTSAAYFFQSNNLWEICDKGSDEKTITELTKRVNGGTNGLSERIKLFNNFFSIINS